MMLGGEDEHFRTVAVNAVAAVRICWALGRYMII